MKIIIFKIGSYKFATKVENLSSQTEASCKPIDITRQMLVRTIDSTEKRELLYYKDHDKTGCIVVNDIEGIVEFEEKDIFLCKENYNTKGVIGYLNSGNDIISLIEIPEFLAQYYAS